MFFFRLRASLISQLVAKSACQPNHPGLIIVPSATSASCAWITIALGSMLVLAITITDFSFSLWPSLVLA